MDDAERIDRKMEFHFGSSFECDTNPNDEQNDCIDPAFGLPNYLDDIPKVEITKSDGTEVGNPFKDYVFDNSRQH